MHRISFFLLLAFFISSFANSDDISSSIQKKLANIDIISGAFFQQRSVAGLSMPLRSRGEFIYWRNKGIYWKTLEPFPESMAFTQQGIIGINNSDLGFSKTIGRYLGEVMLAIFSGDPKKINRFFDSNWSKIGDGWSGTLIPKDKNFRKGISSIEAQGSNFVEHLTIISSVDEAIVINFYNHKKLDDLTADQCRLFSENGDCH